MKCKALRILTVSVFLLSSVNARPASEPGCWSTGGLTDLPDSDHTEVSTDKKHLLLHTHDDPNYYLVDIETGKTAKNLLPENAHVALSGENEVGISTYPALTDYSISSFSKLLKTGKTELTNLKTGKKRVLPGVNIGEDVYTVKSTDPNMLVAVTTDGHLRRIVGAGHLETASVSSKFDPDIILNKKTGIIEVYKGPQKIREFPAPASPDFHIYDTTVSKDHNTVVIAESVAGGTVRSLTVLNLKTRALKKIEIPADHRFDRSSGTQDSAVSPDGKFAVISKNSEKSVLVNLASGELSDFSTEAMFVMFNSEGNLCGETVYQVPSAIACYDVETKKLISKIQKPEVVGSYTNIAAKSFVIRLFHGPTSTSPGMLLWNGNNKCDVNAVTVNCACSSNDDGSPIILGNLKAVAVKAACNKDFAESDWKPLTSNESALSEEAALIWLKKFSKPGGFNPEKNLGVILGILNSEMIEKYPGDVKAAMTGVLFSSSALFGQLRKQYPKLGLSKAKVSTDCWTKNEQEKLSLAVLQHGKRTLLGSMDPLAAMDSIRDVVQDTLNETQKEALSDYGGDRVVDRAASETELQNVFSSKTYKFGYNAMKKAVGLPYQNLTDVTVTRDRNNTLSYLILGNEPFEGATRSLGGFYVKKERTQDVKDIRQDKTDKVTWTYDDKKYSADIALNLGDINKKIINEAPSPDYKNLWKDNVLRGVVIAGTNLGNALSASVMKDYVSYYAAQGFQFEKPQENSDLPGFLKDKVSGNKPMQYFIKEAHSDGDEKNLFRINKAGKILHGTKKVGNRTETIDLVYPNSPTSGGSELVSNREFGKWMQEREANKQSDLLYINSSCWSANKAVYEISAAATAKLVNIPTKTSMTVFSDDKTNVMRTLVHGIRTGKNYAQIRMEMENDPKYKSKKENVFLFPDQDEYKKLVSAEVKNPIAIDTKITETSKAGAVRSYSIEEDSTH